MKTLSLIILILSLAACAPSNQISSDYNQTALGDSVSAVAFNNKVKSINKILKKRALDRYDKARREAVSTTTQKASAFVTKNTISTAVKLLK